MFNMIKMQQKKIVSNAVNLIPSYRPDIDYNWKTTFDGSGNRQLINAGESNPDYKATLYSGRGVKFNGTDQSIDTGVYTITGNTTISFSFIPNKADGQLCILGRARIMLHSNKLQMDLRGSGGFPDVFVSRVLDITKSYGVSIVFYADKIETWLNGILDTVTITPTIGLAYRYIGQRGNSQSFSESTISNITIINHALTPYEIKYQYSHPEKFLYHEKQADGTFIAKSEILSQSKIDSVVAHFPMCETDGFVRNMIGYSESVISGIIDNAPTDDDEVSTYTKNDDTSYDLAVTTAGTNTSRPYLAHSFNCSNSSYHYKVSFDVVVNSGTPILRDMYNGYHMSLNETLKTGHYEFVLHTGNDSYGYLVQYFNGTYEFDISVTNFKVTQLTSTYPIENFTNAARDDAKNLSTGLQTCFWKRDVLGVPVGNSFNEITFDGSGYVDTGYMVTYKEKKQIELVVTKRVGDLSMFGAIIGDIDNYTALYVRFNPHCDNVVGINCNSYGYTELHILDISHIVITIYVDGYEVFLDGASQGLKNTSGGTNDGSSLIIGRINTISYPLIGSLRLFNIHTTPQDPAKLYNDAVKKGLLS